MNRFIIEGCRDLSGSITVSGAKNAILPIMAAALLAPGKSMLRNVPNLIDLKTMAHLLRVLGARVEYENGNMAIDSRDLCFNEERIHIGAAICFHYIINSDAMLFDFQMLKDACQTVASTGIRNRATLVGNICTAVPSLDSAPPLLCHEAIIHCASIAGNRDIPIAKWFLAPRKTALQSNEIVTGVTVPSALGFAGIYLKLGRYGGEDLAQAGWGIMLNYAHHYRIAHCALAPIPARAHSIEALLNGKELTEDLVRQAMELVPHEISPITDMGSSAEYRLQISKVVLQRGLWAALDRLHGKEVEAAKLLGGIA